MSSTCLSSDCGLLFGLRVFGWSRVQTMFTRGIITAVGENVNGRHKPGRTDGFSVTAGDGEKFMTRKQYSCITRQRPTLADNKTIDELG